MIKLFGVPHILILLFIFVLTVALYFLFRNKSEKAKKNLLVGLLLANLLLHFLKAFFPPYSNGTFGSEFHKFTFENVCAVSTMVTPFIYLFVKKESKIFDFFISILFFGGLLGILLATEPVRDTCTLFDLIRYFTCHGILFIVSVLTPALNFHKPKLKDCWILVVGLLAYESLIFCNEIILYLTKLIGDERVNSWDVFFDSNLNNSAFTFGPTPDMGIITKICFAITPDFMEVMHNGYLSCWPVIWTVFPAVILFLPFSLVIWSPCYIAEFLNKRGNKTNK